MPPVDQHLQPHEDGGGEGKSSHRAPGGGSEQSRVKQRRQRRHEQDGALQENAQQRGRQQAAAPAGRGKERAAAHVERVGDLREREHGKGHRAPDDRVHRVGVEEHAAYRVCRQRKRPDQTSLNRDTPAHAAGKQAFAALGGRALHHARLNRLHTESERGHGIRHKIDPEKLDREQR